jgi:cysteine-rich repeat protein
LPNINEQCDDGNKKNGDGCSNNCQIESEYTCTYPSPVTGKSICTKKDKCGNGKPNLG